MSVTPEPPLTAESGARPRPGQERPLARAKRTDRAEARRRHRAATAEADGTVASDLDAPLRLRAQPRLDVRRRDVHARRRHADGRGLPPVVPSRRRARRPRRAALAGHRTRTRSGCRSSSRSWRASPSRWPTTRRSITSLMYDVLRPPAGHRWRVHRRLPRAAGELAARPDRRARVRARERARW